LCAVVAALAPPLAFPPPGSTLAGATGAVAGAAGLVAFLGSVPAEVIPA
jgi:membrane associated rhomboid family serine protease